MTDALKDYEPKDSSIYLKFKDGDEIKLRVLTLDPLVSEKVWPNSPEKIDTKYAFVVWNWNAGRAQVLQVGPGLLSRFTKIHRDEDFEPLNKADIKITATGDMLERRYTVDVLPKAQELTKEMIAEAQKIKLEDLIQDSRGRLSEYSDEGEQEDVSEPAEPKTGYEKAKETASKIKGDDVVDFDIGDEPIKLEDIPF